MYIDWDEWKQETGEFVSCKYTMMLMMIKMNVSSNLQSKKSSEVQSHFVHCFFFVFAYYYQSSTCWGERWWWWHHEEKGRQKCALLCLLKVECRLPWFTWFTSNMFVFLVHLTWGGDLSARQMVWSRGKVMVVSTTPAVSQLHDRWHFNCCVVFGGRSTVFAWDTSWDTPLGYHL